MCFAYKLRQHWIVSSVGLFNHYCALLTINLIYNRFVLSLAFWQQCLYYFTLRSTYFTNHFDLCDKTVLFLFKSILFWELIQILVIRSITISVTILLTNWWHRRRHILFYSNKRMTISFCKLNTLLRVIFEHAAQQLTKFRRNSYAVARQIELPSLYNRSEKLWVIATCYMLIRKATKKHLVEHSAEWIHVTLHIVGLALSNFRCHG